MQDAQVQTNTRGGERLRLSEEATKGRHARQLEQPRQHSFVVVLAARTWFAWVFCPIMWLEGGSVLEWRNIERQKGRTESGRLLTLYVPRGGESMRRI